MENLKIRVNNEAESKEAQELFFELGYGWRGVNPKNSIFIPKKLKEYFIINYENTKDMQLSGIFDNSETLKAHKEITLPELRDMVNPKKEYLTPLRAGGFSYRQAYDQGYIPESWIEIPEGAEFATGVNELAFRKDGFYWDNGRSLVSDEPHWVGSKITLASAKSNGFNIPWVREDQLKPSLNDIAKTAEDHRQSLMVRPEDAPIELTSFGYFPEPEPNPLTALNSLCDEFGCPPGAHRMSWLRQQLVTAKRDTDSQPCAKEPVTIDRETARHRLAMMFRGERTTINGREVVFNASGCFDVRQDFCSGHFSTSLKATLDYLFKGSK